MIYSMMVFYPTFSSDVALIDKLISNYPEALLKAFGMSSGLSMASVLGYFSFTFAFTQLLLAVQAANYGFSVLSVEEREFTADYLMSKPVSRHEILSAKCVAAFLALSLTNFLTWAAAISGIELFRNGNPYELRYIVLLLSTIVIFQMLFFTVGMLVSVMLKRIRNVLSFSLAFAFGTYILNTVRAIVGGDLLGWLSPYYYFDPVYILENGSLKTPLLFMSFVIVLVSIGTTVFLYGRRNIHSL
jgi:ABC-2 type transport system permease protein